jgi:beta-glucuronidase
VVTSDVFIEQYGLHLDQDQDILLAKKNTKFKISGIIKLNKTVSQSKITLEIPELKITKEYSIDGDSLSFNLTSKKLKLWSPENPKLYNISLSYNGEKITDKIGFRKIETSGKTILLNGKPVFLKGICLHEEIAEDIRRAYNKKDAEHLFRWVKDLNANMVRLAHYPHNEYMTRLADSLGILVWSEIPVYWTIQFENKTVLDKANNQLKEMIYRDQNRASVIIWSVGNETPVNETRTEFMSTLAIKAKKLDNTRLISAALQVQHTKGDVYLVDDPLGEYVDIVSINEYIGWYDGLPEKANTTSWEIKYNKPLFFSETGAGAKGGFHADKETRWSEEFQEWYYKNQIEMFKNNMPENYSGLSPWILVDFRSPRRNNPETQEGWNRKGLIDNNGVKKKAFYILKAYYDSIKN